MTRLCAFALAAAVCVGTTSVMAAKHGVTPVAPITYSNPEQTYLERIVVDTVRGWTMWQISAIDARRRIVAADGNPLAYHEVSMGYVHECSDKRVRCLFGHYSVFAVPRAGLKARTIYQAGGAELMVVECLRGHDDDCQVALISSNCQLKVSPDGCKMAAGGRSSGIEPGPVTYFIYNEDFGVTAFGKVPQPSSSAGGQRAAAVGVVLRSERGLLFSPARTD